MGGSGPCEQPCKQVPGKLRHIAEDMLACPVGLCSLPFCSMRTPSELFMNYAQINLCLCMQEIPVPITNKKPFLLILHPSHMPVECRAYLQSRLESLSLPATCKISRGTMGSKDLLKVFHGPQPLQCSTMPHGLQFTISDHKGQPQKNSRWLGSGHGSRLKPAKQQVEREVSHIPEIPEEPLSGKA